MNGRARFGWIAAAALTLGGIGMPPSPPPRAQTTEVAEAKIPVSRAFEVNGLVMKPKIYDRAELRQRPVTTETVYFNTGAGPVSATFTGVLLWTLLDEAGIKVDPAVKNDLLRRTITVSATDGYTAVLSAGEIAPQFGGELVIVAYAQDGGPLGADGGFARLIVPGDQAGGRNVSSIARIEVR